MPSSRQWTVGRAADCEIVVAQAEVSSRHCRLTETSEGFFLEDLGSSNGTYVNGERLQGRRQVQRQDRITLGKKVPLPWPAAVGEAPSAPKTRVVHIGRAADNDVVLDFPMVSAHHARLVSDGTSHRLEDLDSTNGTAVGHPGRKIRQAALTPDAVVYFGSLRVPAARLLARAAPAEGEQARGQVEFRGKEMVLGRSAACDLVLDYPMISSRHARLTRVGGRILLEDLGSAGGTFLNHARVHGPTVVGPEDVIGLGSYTFTLRDGGGLQRRDSRGNVTLEARGVTVVAGGRRLIEGCSLTIWPTELVALMGPGGAGKTTLMRALNGYTPPTGGQVLLNGQDLYQHFDQYRLALGYVPQDDIVHRELTVYEALWNSARLRLPTDFSNDELDRRVRAVLRQLNLEAAANVLIGSPERKGISGGQRRRVNLAMELLTEPLVLFLDEPTSGLSSEDALVVIKMLRELADQGKTILITIHQPSLEIYRLLDNVIMVGKDTNSPEPGRLVYYGPAYPDALEFFNPRPPGGLDSLGPEDLFRGMAKRPAADWLQGYTNSDTYRRFVSGRAADKGPGKGAAGGPARRTAAGWLQWRTLTARCLTIKIRDRVNTAILLAQAPVVGLLLAAVFGEQLTQELAGGQDARKIAEDFQEKSQGLSTATFMLGLAALWFGASNAVREIVGEWAIYQRERMVSLSIPAYLASKYTVLGALCVVQCATLLAIVSWGCGLKASPVTTGVLLLLSALVGVGVGLTLSALARTSEAAIALLPIVLIAMVTLGGAFQQVHKMARPMRTLALVNPVRWAFEGIVTTEARSRKTYTPPQSPLPGAPEAEEIDMAENAFPKKDQRLPLWVSYAALLAELAVLTTGILVILRLRDIARPRRLRVRERRP